MRIPLTWFAFSVVIITNLVLIGIYLLSMKYIKFYRNQKAKNKKLLRFMDQKIAIKLVSLGKIFF